MAAEGCGRMRKMTILIKCFRFSRKAWLHSDYFKRTRFYAIAAAVSGLMASGIFFWCYKWIFGALFILIAILNIFLNWFIWFVIVLREHYGNE